VSLRRDTAAAVALQGLGLASSTGVFLLFRLRLGIPAYGVYSALQGIVLLVVLCTMSWVSPLILQMHVRDHLARREILGRTVTMSVVLVAIGALAVGMLSGVFLPGRPLLPLFLLFATETSTQLLFGGLASFLQVREGFVAASVARAIPVVIKATVAATALIVVTMSMNEFIAVLACSSAVASMGAMVYSISRAGPSPWRGHPRRGDVASGLSYASTSVLYSVQDDFDKVLMLRSRPELEAGQYATAYRVFQMALYPVSALVSASHTRLLSASDDPATTYRSARRYARLALAYAVGTALVGLVLSGWIAHLVKSDPAIVRVLCFLGVGKATADFALNNLIGLGRNWERTVMVGAAAGLNVVGNLVFIPHFGWRAAATTTLASDVLLSCVAWAVLRRRSARAADALPAWPLGLAHGDDRPSELPPWGPPRPGATGPLPVTAQRSWPRGMLVVPRLRGRQRWHR
jgi:O-antigen/teichoic acid export membrane protein